MTSQTPTLPTAAVSQRRESRRIAIVPPSSTLGIYTWHVFRRNLRIGMIWAIALGLYLALIVLVFPSLKESGSLDAIQNYPANIQKAFNLEGLVTIESFVGAEVYSYAPLVLAFMPIMAFSAAIAGAEERGALDIIMGTPLPRRNLVLATWITTAVLLLGVFVIGGAISWLASMSVDAGLSFRAAMRGSLAVFPIAIAFGSFALLLSARLRQRGSVIGITFAVMFLMYLIDIIGKIATGLDWLRWASAFRFYGNAIVTGIDWGDAAVLLVVSVLLLAAAIPVFDQRDIYT